MSCVLELVVFVLVAAWVGLKHKKQRLEVTINIAEDSDWEIYSRIKKALGSTPRVLFLELVGFGRIHPNALLSIHDLLLNRDPSTQIHVGVRTNLADGSLIFLIHAQSVEIRRNTWFQVASVEDLCSKIGDEGEGWKRSLINTVEEPTTVTDYRNITAILNEYLPLNEFAKRRLPLESTMKEFGLIQNRQEKEALQRLFAA